MLSTKKQSLKQEREVAEANDGKVNPGSGNGWRHKNDVRSADVSFECKTTSKTHYSFRLSDFDTALTYAWADGKSMAFVTDIDGKRYYTVNEVDWQCFTEESHVSFLFRKQITARMSIRLVRLDLDDLEVDALSQERDPILISIIQGRSFYTMRDYTWHMLRGD